ncbi:MAG TPA: ABC transporter permease [Blastocatellia bacterium]|nr:ABC transporter permease [Blastocatellia bacterium]
MASRLRLWLRALLHKAEVERELEEELRYHVERQAELNVRLGMGAEEARRAALRQFGGVEQAKEASRDARGVRWLEELLQDLRYGARMLRKQPGFTLIAVATLSLGIGANTAIFSVVNAVLLRPLPYGDADRLVIVWEANQQTEQNTISPANFFAWQEQNSVFAGMAAFFDTRNSLSGDGEPEEVPGQIATDNLFSVLSVNAMLGRTFTPEDGKPGQNNVVVISYGLWQRRFGGDPNIIGRQVILNAVEHTVIGVLPPDVKWHVRKNSQTGRAAELWRPWAISNEVRQLRGRFICAVARLRDGATLAQARAEMGTIAGRLAEQYKQFNSGYGINVVPLRQQFAGEIRLALLVLLGAVGFVLLIACANVANLQLSRAAARRKEIAVRAALGAGRGRIMRQLLTESLLLAAMGGVAGLVLAWGGAEVLVSLSPPELGDFQDVEISAPVLGFTFAVVLLTGIIFGLAPATEALNIRLSDTLKEAGRSLAGNARSRRLRSALVVAEIALALVLLVGAGLLARSFLRLRGVDMGFNARNVLTMRVTLPGVRYDQDARRINFFTEALERMQTLPGVEAAGAINYTPFLGLGTRTGFDIEGRAKPLPDQPMGTTDVCVTDENFFRALQIQLKRGRLFTGQEVRERRNVVVINEALAKKYFPNEDPLGRRLIIPLRPPTVPTEIIGVVGDVKHTGLGQPTEPMSYWPIAQEPYPFMTFVLRTRGDATAVAAAVRNVVQTLDPQQPVGEVRTLASLVGDSIARQRFNMLLLAVFAVVALLLSAVGIYGVMSYAVAQRTHEVGIRAALGATAADILRLVLKEGVKLTLLGVAVGLLAAVALTRLLKNLLFGVGVTDPLTFVALPLLLAGVALLACYLPARRATKVDPLVALRHE